MSLCSIASRQMLAAMASKRFALRILRAQTVAHFATATTVPTPVSIDWLPDPPAVDPAPLARDDATRPQHAVLSTFDLMSIGIGPSSSHSVGPMRAGKMFVESIKDLGVLQAVKRIRIALYGSLAATGKGHLSPQALLLGLEGHVPETIDPAILMPRYNAINESQSMVLAGERQITFDIRRDLAWHWDQTLPEHPNGLIISVYDEQGDLLATNRYFSIGGGFVIHGNTQRGENIYYKSTRPQDVQISRRRVTAEETPALPTGTAPETLSDRDPPFPFHSADSLLEMSRQADLTIAQICWENECAYLSPEVVRAKALDLWAVMNECIRQGVSSTEEYLPGPLKVKRRARNLHARLLRGLFPGDAMPRIAEIGNTRESTNVQASASHLGTPQVSSSRSKYGLPPPVPLRGRRDHPLKPIPPRRTVFPAIDLLSCYAIATNEVNAAGGRIVTAPTNGAAGIIPSVLKYVVEFISDDPDRDIITFLFTASAIGQLFKRGATISAAEGGCMAEVGVATSMAAAGFTAIMGGSPEQVERAAEIAIEHSLGLTCDPIGGLVQVPCIERNALGAVKAVSAAQLALASVGDGSHTVSLDQAIAAMRQTAKDMHTSYKETSRAGLATAVGLHRSRIPVSVPEC